ncbi:MAG: tRNA 2-thiocytidine biosynthesis TtcA family protein [Firmicutes bacterium]|nr:tRNA 2-thiocytidine biosynthesis TtcA family protein [Bacillota bacterium]
MIMDRSLKRVTSLARKAIEDYNMIADGDRVAVGVSGGKDSLTLLCALAELSRYYPKKFTVTAVTLDMGFHADWSGVKRLCDELDVEYIVKQTQIKDVIFDIRRESNPCSLCAKMRRGSLNDAVKEAGCNRVALGHHMDDAIETFFLSLFYEGRLNCFSPVTYLSRSDLYQIRPMIYAEERLIRGAVKNNSLPVVSNPCPADGETKREDMKRLIKTLEGGMQKGLKTRLFTAIRQGLPDWKTGG